MKAITTLFAGAVLLATGGSAIAQEQGGGRALTRDQAVARADQRFARLDVNRDGSLTREEARQGRQMRRGQRQGQRQGQAQGAGMARQFDRLDANRDGSLSREEFSARRAMRAQRRAARGNGGGAFGADGVMTREEFRARALQRFARLDTNRDGTVTRVERQAMRQQRN